MAAQDHFITEYGVLTGYEGPGGSITLPGDIASVGPRAFLDNQGIRSVRIPEGVTELAGDFFSEEPAGAFSGCVALSAVSLPESLLEIGCWTFSGCRTLRSVEIPASVGRIGNRAFLDCKGLRAVTIPDGVREIDYGVFMGCTGLVSVDIPQSVTVIREFAFADCANLEHIELPQRVKTVDYSAFRGCASLRNLLIPDGAVEIGDLAFENCTSLMGVTVPASVSRIGENAFRNCPDLTLRVRAGSIAETYAKEHDIPSVTYEALRDAAGEMLRRSYSPYSHFPVGAALECEDGTVFTGCNVENASFPAGICAERNAIFHAVAEGHTRFSRIVVMGQGSEFCVPCGICRQVMAEFTPNMEVICLNGRGEERHFLLRDLLPNSFGPQSLTGKPAAPEKRTLR